MKNIEKGRLYVLRKTENGRVADIRVVSTFLQATNGMKRVISLLIKGLSSQNGWDIPDLPKPRDLGWSVTNSITGHSISFEIRVREVEFNLSCGTCFHATWDCTKCLLGRKEIHKDFMCRNYLSMSDRALGWLNEMREENNLPTYGAKVLSERAMTNEDIPEQVSKC